MRESKANRLINETSPYLLQHAFNPVDWRPWSMRPFKKLAWRISRFGVFRLPLMVRLIKTPMAGYGLISVATKDNSNIFI